MTTEEFTTLIASLLVAILGLILAVIAIAQVLITKSTIEKLEHRILDLKQQFNWCFQTLKTLKQTNDTIERKETAVKTESATIRDVGQPCSPPTTALGLTLDSQTQTSSAAISQPIPSVRQYEDTDISKGEQVSIKESLEEKLGAKLFVWIGGIALLLAGIFLVKYSFERNLLSPAIRLSMGTLFGIALLVAAECMHKRSSIIGQVLSGAGIADLFACILAAVHIYHMLAPTIAMTLMTIVVAAAIILSLRHGYAVAVMGLLGGFATPALIGWKEPPVELLFIYLFILEIGLIAVTRRKGWLLLPALTLVAVVLWTLWAMLSGTIGDDISKRLWLIGFAFGNSALFIFNATRAAPGKTFFKPIYLSSITVFSVSILLAVLSYANRFSPVELGFFALIGLGGIVLARIDQRYVLLPWVGVCITVTLLLTWIDSSKFVLSDHSTTLLFIRFLVGFGLIYALGGYLCLWGQTQKQLWASLSVLSAIVFYIVARLKLYHFGEENELWIAGACLSLLYVCAVVPLFRLTSKDSSFQQAADAITLGVAGLLTLTCMFAFDPPETEIAWAVLVITILAAHEYLRINILQYAIIWLTILIGGLLCIPAPVWQSVSDHVIFNMITLQYGSAAAAFMAIAWRMYAMKREQFSAVYQVLCAITVLVMTCLLIRHGFHPEDMLAKYQLLETGTLSLTWLLLGLAIILVYYYSAIPSLLPLGSAVCMFGLICCVLGSCMIFNPLWHDYSIGRIPIFNWLLYLYALPAAIAVVFAYLSRQSNYRTIATISAFTGLFLVFLLVSLNVRQFYAGAFITFKFNPVSSAESYTYSLAWIILGSMFLIAGIGLKSAALRYGSLIVMLVAIGKVFFFDLSHLKDLWRVLSFLGLGISLIVLGYIYQQFVFKKQDTPNRLNQTD